jgi:hypothetical protein
MNDTDPEIEELVHRRLMECSGAERVMMGSRMFDAAKAMILASFPPDLSPIEVKVRLCERLYGDEVDIDGFPVSMSTCYRWSRRAKSQRDLHFSAVFVR